MESDRIVERGRRRGALQGGRERQMWRLFNDLWDVLGSGFLSSRFL